jgi:hypothetical protein
LSWCRAFEGKESREWPVRLVLGDVLREIWDAAEPYHLHAASRRISASRAFCWLIRSRMARSFSLVTPHSITTTSQARSLCARAQAAVSRIAGAAFQKLAHDARRKHATTMT